MIGGLAGRALSTIGNSGGLASQYPLGLAGQIGGLNNQISPQAEGGNFFGSGTSFGVGGLVGQLLPPIDPAKHRDVMGRERKRGRIQDLINDPAATPGEVRNGEGFLGTTLPRLAQGLPNGEQGPSQGPNTPVKNYPGMGYGPVGPMGGGLPPTPMASMYGGPQMGQAMPQMGQVGGLLGNANFFNDPMTIKRVS
jgi:hypothetical protein